MDSESFRKTFFPCLHFITKAIILLVNRHYKFLHFTVSVRRSFIAGKFYLHFLFKRLKSKKKLWEGLESGIKY